jgi:hypothetical protein
VRGGGDAVEAGPVLGQDLQEFGKVQPGGLATEGPEEASKVKVLVNQDTVDTRRAGGRLRPKYKPQFESQYLFDIAAFIPNFKNQKSWQCQK